MRNLSTEFKEQQNSGNRNYLKYADFTFTDGSTLSITDKDLWSNGFKFEDAVSQSGSFDIGAAIVNKLTLQINNFSGKYTDYIWDGARVVCYIGLELSTGIEKIRICTMTVTDAPYQSTAIISLTCEDSMRLFDRDYSESTGYTRVYDKRQQLLKKDHIDIGREVTRIEWESRSGDPVTMDPPFLLGNLGSHEVLRFVPMNDWPAALRTYDPRTAAKIKKNCLRLLPFDPNIYDGLRDRLLSVLGLTAAENMDHYDKRQMEQVNAQAQELEKMMAALRKFAQVED